MQKGLFVRIGKIYITASTGAALLFFQIISPATVLAQANFNLNETGVTSVHSEYLNQDLQITDKYQTKDFISYTNQIRIERGLIPLNENTELDQAAMAKAYDMAIRGYWDHYRPVDSKAPWDFILEQGYQYRSAGENLARGYVTPKGITLAWENSPTHLANLISSKYTEVGFASIQVTNSIGEKTLLTVQMFGRQ